LSLSALSARGGALNITIALPDEVANSYENKIAQGDTYRVFTMVDMNVLEPMLGCYTTGGRFNSFYLTNTTYNDFVFESQVACLTNNRVVVASRCAITGQPTIVQEYDLIKDVDLPTNAVFVSEFIVSPGANWMTMCRLTNGGVAVFTYPSTNGNFGVSYRAPGGGWTNMPVVPTNGVPGIFPAFLSSAENPVDNSAWVFANRDSCGCIWAANFYPTNSGLFLSQSGVLIGPYVTNLIYRDDSMVPYGELEDIHAVTDWTNGVIKLMYPSFFYNVYNVTNSQGQQYYGDTPVVVSSVVNFTNRTLTWFNTNRHTARLSVVTGSVPSSNTTTITYVQSSPSIFLTGLRPLLQQDLVSGVEQNPFLVSYIADNSTYFAHPYCRDVVYLSTNSTWYLKIGENFPAPTKLTVSNIKVKGMVKFP
jgi:hypothetical protein